MVNDDWVKEAMTDDTVVVELLLRLKQLQAASLSSKSQPVPAAILPLSWGIKQPRSRLSAASRCDGAVSRRKESDSTRCSPTTPLSWSGGGSPSGTADGYEESSRPTVLSHQAARSKATATSEYTGNSTSSTKRCRRKKTFAELKEEESSLLEERLYLKQEIANLNATFKAQRARNENLKRIKLDLGAKSQNNPSSSTSDELLCTLSGQPHQRMISAKALTHAHATDDKTHIGAMKTESTGESCFVIPDLNMMPSEDDALCGMS
ncbi:hypothetical protein L6164_024358 [Bauhinia variegata]|uniref:Uncharacterized protein n=1 Tax=Bauhinia variegata TaxID=167791 RepID=A0ACB9LXJ4_BAUVA|nr:hypothetical protein L6164_024358 [Bauhinia variegata]